MASGNLIMNFAPKLSTDLSRLALALSLASSALGGAPQARAADTIGLNLEPVVEARRWQAPVFSYGRDDRKGAVFKETVQQFAPVPGIRVSYEPGQLFIIPEFLGQRFRYVASYSRLEDTRTASSMVGNTTNPFLVGIGGTGIIDMASPARFGLQVDYGRHDFHVGVATDYMLGRLVSLSPSLGVAFGQSRQRYRLVIEEVGTFRDTVNETVRRRYVGPILGLQLGVQVLDGLRLHGGMSGAVIWSNATLTGDDCAGSGAAVACDGGFFRSNLDRSFDSWGWRGAANLGLSVAIGPATATVEGMFDAETARHRIVNPAVTGAGPARLENETTFGFGGRVSVLLPF